MKKFRSVLGICLLLAMAMGSFAGAFVPLSPTATYGVASIQPDAGATPTTWILLSGLGGLGTITPGTTVLTFQGTGDLCYFPTCPASIPEINTNTFSNPFAAGFTTALGSTTFLATGQPAANTGLVGTTDWQATFANQFFIQSSGGTNVLVPTGALYIVFALRDSHYSDNSNPNGDQLGININLPAAIPEPGSYRMLLTGLGGLFAMRHFRRS